jgi:hypothetical protein
VLATFLGRGKYAVWEWDKEKINVSGKGFRNGSRMDGGAGGGEMQEHSFYRPIEYYFYLGDSFGSLLIDLSSPLVTLLRGWRGDLLCQQQQWGSCSSKGISAMPWGNKAPR